MVGRTDRCENAGRGRAREPSAPDLPADLSAGTLPADDLIDGAIHLCLAFDGTDLSGRDAADAEIDQCRYDNVNLNQTTLRRARIRDAVFDRCDLANVRARDCTMLRTAVSDSRMTGIAWLSGELREVTFGGCRMDFASLPGSSLRNVVFDGCRLVQADFGYADLSGARFDDCDLTDAQFAGARMVGAVLRRCDLAGISGVTSLRGAVLTGTDAMRLAFTLAAALGITIDDG